jgi:tetratricopeptide (TPR) repeat protein
MKLKLLPIFLLVFAAAWLAAVPLSAQTNIASTATNDTVANGYLQIQEQLHATQLAIEQNSLAATEEAKKNADALAARLQSLEQTVAAQRANEAEAARRTQQFTLVIAAVFGVAGLGVLLLMVYFQWRAFSQIAQISTQQHAALANAGAVHQLAAPGRATVEISNARLLDVVGQLEKKILDLESSRRLLAEPAGANTFDPLAEGQQFLEANEPQKALAAFDQFLAAQPNHAEALAKKASALEKLGKLEAALTYCDRAIAQNGTDTVALLQKGGLLNKLNRHAEALDCFEQALRAREKKSGAKIS